MIYSDGKRKFWRHVCPLVPSMWAFKRFFDQGGLRVRPHVERPRWGFGPVKPGGRRRLVKSQVAYWPLSMPVCPWCEYQRPKPLEKAGGRAGADLSRPRKQSRGARITLITTATMVGAAIAWTWNGC